MTGTAPPAGPNYRTPADLRRDHRELLRRSREGTDPAALEAEVRGFVDRGRRAGRHLDADRDRRDAQSMLDYWATVLSGSGGPPVDADLDEFDPDLAPDLAGTACPYLGLSAFREDAADRFFGRDRLVAEMIGLLADQPLLAVSGPSGSGKSSLVLAGLLPALAAGKGPGSDRWRYYRPFVPGSEPLVNLARAIRPPDADPTWDVRAVAAELAADPTALARRVTAAGPEPAVLVVDQFEELFTLTADESVRRAFVDAVGGLTTADGPPHHRVVLTVRSDYEAHLARFPALGRLAEDRRLRVVPTPLGPADLRLAIEEPARRVGLRFEDGLVDKLVKEVLGEPAALPLLQFTLLELWKRKRRNRVTNADYDALGGARHALAKTADHFHDALIPEEQTTLRRLCLRLVRPGDGLEVVRDRVRRAELVNAVGEDAARVERVLGKMVDAHLLRLTPGETPADDQVEVVHEALVRNWPLFVRWQDEARDEQRLRHRLTDTAELWNKRGRDAAVLLRGRVLDDARQFQNLSAVEREFLDASQAAADKAAADKTAAERRKREEEDWLNRLYRGVAAVGMLLSVTLLLLAFYAWNQEKAAKDLAAEATSEKDRADAATRLAKAEARNSEVSLKQKHEQQVRSNADRVLRMAVQEAGPQTPHVLQLTRMAVEALQEVGADTANLNKEFYRMLPGDQPAFVLPGPPRPNARGPSSPRLAFDSRGRHLALWFENGPMYVWRTRSGDRGCHVLPGPTDVTAAAFQPDGKRLAVGTQSGEVLLFGTEPALKAETSGESAGRVPMKLGSRVTAVAVSNDTRLVAAADIDGTAKVWAAETGSVRCEFKTAEGCFTGLVFHIDGKRIGTVGGASGQAHIWGLVDRSPTAPLASFPTDDGPVTDLAFDNDPRVSGKAATLSDRGQFRVWTLSATGPQPVCAFSTPNSPSGGIAFRNDGEVAAWLLNSGGDPGVGVWDSSRGNIQFTTQQASLGQQTQAFALSADGARFAAYYPDWSPPRDIQGIGQRAGHWVGVSTTWQAGLLRTLWSWADFTARQRGLTSVIRVSELRNTEPPLDKILRLAQAAPPAMTLDHYRRVLEELDATSAGQLRRAEEVVRHLGDTDEALKHVRSALQLPGIKVDLDKEARRLVAEMLNRRGLELTREGKLGMDPAVYFRRAQEVDPGFVLGPRDRSQPLLNRGYELARQMKYEEAVTLFREAAAVDPTLQPFDPEKVAGRATAQAWVSAGYTKARQNKVADAIDAFRTAARLDPDRKLNPEREASRTAAEEWRVKGNERARQGNTDTAIAAFREAVRLDPELKLNPEREANGIASQYYQSVAEDRGRAGQLEEARAALRTAAVLNPDLKLDPDWEVNRLGAQFFRTDAETKARAGLLDAARAAFRRAAELNPDLKLDPEEEVSRWALVYYRSLMREPVNRFHVDEVTVALREVAGRNPGLGIDPGVLARQLVATARREEAKKLATSGRVEEAAEHLHRAVALDDRLKFNPQAEARRLSAGFYRTRGQEAARQFDVDAALLLLRRAAEYDRTLNIDPQTEAGRPAATSYKARGLEAAQRFDIDTALEFFDRAKRLDPSLNIDPDDEVRAARLLKARVLAAGGDIDEAAKLIEEVGRLHPTKPVDAVTWNQLCWSGCLHGQAELVQKLGAGDNAVNGATAQQEAGYRDTRGLARALTGDVAGAIEDFQFYVDRLKKQNPPRQTAIAKREGWIRDLKAKKDPKQIFTPELLKQLRNE